VLVAGVAHGVTIAAMLRGPLSDEPCDSTRSASSPPALFDIHVDIVDATIDALSVAVDPPSRGRRAPGEPAGLKGRRSAAVHGRRYSFDSPARATLGEELTSHTPPSRIDARPSLTLDQLGIAGPERLALRASPEPQSAPCPADAPRAPSSDGVLRSMRQLAQDHDRKVGLGAGGAVATALENVVYESETAPVGEATFEVLVIDNVVSNVSLLMTQGPDPGLWNLVATNAVTRLANRRLRVPMGRRAVLQIRVQSRVALPSGHDPGVEVRVGPFVVQRGRGPQSARLSFLTLDPGAPQEISARSQSGGLPSPSGGVNVVQTDIDPVDLGARARPVVHAYTLDERVLD
jgi:hypothetical protein